MVYKQEKMDRVMGKKNKYWDKGKPRGRPRVDPDRRNSEGLTAEEEEMLRAADSKFCKMLPYVAMLLTGVGVIVGLIVTLNLDEDDKSKYDLVGRGDFNSSIGGCMDKSHFFGDLNCDLVTNNEECRFDGMDCCSSDRNSFNLCKGHEGCSCTFNFDEDELNKTLQAKEILRLPMDLEDFEFLDISDVLAKIITVFVNDSLVNQTTTLPEIIPDNVRPILNYTFFYVSNEQICSMLCLSKDKKDIMIQAKAKIPEDMFWTFTIADGVCKCFRNNEPLFNPVYCLNSFGVQLEQNQDLHLDQVMVMEELEEDAIEANSTKGVLYIKNEFIDLSC